MAAIISWGVGLAFIGLTLWAALAVAGGRGRVAARRKGGGLQVMAAMLFGLGAVLDPPQRHAAEARDESSKGSPENGEPGLDD